MTRKQTIAIVGVTSPAGRDILDRLLRLPCRLLLVSERTGELQQLVAEIREDFSQAEVEALQCVKDGCWEADVIVLAVPPSDEKEIALLMKEVATQKTVVVLAETGTTCGELQALLPYSRILYAFSSPVTGQKVLSGKGVAMNEEVSAMFGAAGYQVQGMEEK